MAPRAWARCTCAGTPDVRLSAQIHGGGHERNMRSGTLATHQIVGMGEALALAVAERDAEQARLARAA